MRLLRYHFVLALAVGLHVSSAALPAHAETGTWLEIHRDPGSSRCPDQESVFRSIARLFPRARIRASVNWAQSSASATVYVRPTLEGGHEALIRVSRPREGERVIIDRDAGCEGLGDALAVALVMLIEPERAAPSQESPPPPATGNLASAQRDASQSVPGNGASQSVPGNTVSARTEAFAATPQTQNKPGENSSKMVRPMRSGANLNLSTGNPNDRAMRPLMGSALSAFAIGGLGLVSEPSAGIGAGLAVSWGSGFGFVLEGAKLWSLPEERAPGRIEIDLYAALGGACYRQPMSAWATLGGCLVLGGGAQTAAAYGYAINSSKTRPWLVLGPRLELGLRWTEWLEGIATLS
ncbi:MAG TPA: hypothetical protein VKP30_18145, partial [Polyangiaceae bacterium]|nr:hypothetical protein [Polyangiaceae bacterium]